jgi:hypothetical protein
VGEIISKNEIFDYEAKYQPGMAEEIFPADLPDDVTREAQRLALETHRVLKLQRLQPRRLPAGRRRAALVPRGEHAAGDDRGQPGPEVREAAGIAFPRLCERICELAIEEHRERPGVNSMAYRDRSTGYSFGYGLTPWVKRLLIANVVVYLAMLALPVLGVWLALIPAHTLSRPWTLVTYMFVHGGFFHLFFNMIILFFFGPPLEGSGEGRSS